MVFEHTDSGHFESGIGQIPITVSIKTPVPRKPESGNEKGPDDEYERDNRITGGQPLQFIHNVHMKKGPEAPSDYFSLNAFFTLST